MNEAISIQGICRSYGGRRVLDDISFSLPGGTVSGLLGPNGAGKTTLFAIIAGFIRAEAGTVLVQGLDHRDPALLGRIGVLPQDAAFQADLSILDQLGYLAQLSGRGRDQAEADVARLLARVGLGDWLGRRSTELSHGMHKRLGVAQAFLGDPQLVLLDEPTAGLDAANARAVRELIRGFAAESGRAVVVSSHDLAEMQELCSHVAILSQGRLASCGPVAELCREQRRLRFQPARQLTAAERAALAAEAWVQGLEDIDGWIQVLVASDDEATRLQRWLLERGILIQRFQSGLSLAEHVEQVTQS